MEKFFKPAFDRIIAQTDLPSSITEPLFSDMEKFYPSSPKEMKHAASRLIGDRDWSWSWFDEWLVVFQASRKWPTNAAWYYFEEQPQPPRNLPSVLEAMTVAEMRDMGNRFGVSFKGCKNRGDVEEAMKSNLQWRQIKEEVEAKFKETVLSAHYENQKFAKLELLALTIFYLAFSLYRTDQINELKKVEVFEHQVWIAPDDCKHARDAAARFNKGESTDLPPYYPGDRSDIRTKRLGIRQR